MSLASMPKSKAGPAVPPAKSRPGRWAIMASHATRDEVRFHCKSGTHVVVTFPTEVAAHQEIEWHDRRRKAGQSSLYVGFNLYAVDLDAGRLA